MTEAMPFLQKYDITFLRPPTIPRGLAYVRDLFQLFPPLLACNTAPEKRKKCFVFDKSENLE